MPNQIPYPTIRAISRQYRIPLSKLNRWVREGKIPALLFDKRGWRRCPPQAVSQILKLYAPLNSPRKTFFLCIYLFVIGISIALLTKQIVLNLFGWTIVPLTNMIINLLGRHIAERYKFYSLRAKTITFMISAMVLGTMAGVVIAPVTPITWEWNTPLTQPPPTQPPPTQPPDTQPPPTQPPPTQPPPTQPPPTQPPHIQPPSMQPPPTQLPTDELSTYHKFDKKEGVCTEKDFPPTANPHGWNEGSCP